MTLFRYYSKQEAYQKTGNFLGRSQDPEVLIKSL